MDQSGNSEKSRLACLLLCFFLGWLGAHRFYTGKMATGILMIVTSGGAIAVNVWPIGGVWVAVDLIFILCGIFRDKKGLRVIHWMEKSV
jgi:TM2 domain-containing membrane protein YozV